MLERVSPGPRSMRRARHWATELVIVVVGVLLALWAQAWFEARQERRVHRDTVEQMDALVGRALVLTASRVSSSACSRDRIAALDDALRSSNGHWQGMPLRGLPDGMVVGHYPVVYVVDSDVLPLQIFATARQNGTMVALEPEVRRFYEKVERELNWLNDVWNSGVNPGMQLSVLGLDGPLSEGARDGFRQSLAWLDGENRVTVLRARSLARLARERGGTLSPDDVAAYRAKLERDRRIFGDCVVEVDPLDLTPATVATSAPANQ